MATAWRDRSPAGSLRRKKRQPGRTHHDRDRNRTTRQPSTTGPHTGARRRRTNAVPTPSRPTQTKRRPKNRQPEISSPMTPIVTATATPGRTPRRRRDRRIHRHHRPHGVGTGTLAYGHLVRPRPQHREGPVDDRRGLPAGDDRRHAPAPSRRRADAVRSRSAEPG